ncbi:MAG TPA: DUF2027 domain-containing protein [Bacteroidales bacterium]|nr:DUF2027 domain-containing protein [Bacteroidales bacterium]
MGFRIGDKVKFLNEAGGGVIKKFLANNQAMVEIEDGFEINTLLSNLVHDTSAQHIALDVEPEAKPTKVEKPKNFVKEPQDKASGPTFSEKKIVSDDKALVCLAIVPVGLDSAFAYSLFDLYILNDSNYDILFTAAQVKDNIYRLIEKGELEAGMSMNIGQYTLEKLKTIQRIVVDVLYFSTSSYISKVPTTHNSDFAGIAWNNPETFSKNDYFDEPAIIIQLGRKTSFKSSSKTNKDVVKIESEAQVVNETEEVDLHIEEITDSIEGLQPGEILQMQMARFETTLEGALKAKTKRIVYIHGVGNGKLRYEIQKVLKNKYPSLQYQDASYAEYGFGATMVILKK